MIEQSSLHIILNNLKKNNSRLSEQSKKIANPIEKQQIDYKRQYLDFFYHLLQNESLDYQNYNFKDLIQMDPHIRLLPPTAHKDGVFGKMSTYLCKVSICGDGAVGKTSLCQAFFGKDVQKEYQPTIGADFFSACVNVNFGALNTIKFQIWDLAGQPRFSTVRQGFYKGSAGSIIMYDITRFDTFINLFMWIAECWGNIGHPIPLVILGNKQDLLGERLVSEDLVQSVIKRLSRYTEEYKGFRITYLPASTKTNLNINDAFKLLAFEIIEWKHNLNQLKKAETLEKLPS